MLKVEKTEVVGWEAAIRGMRNPLNSWDKSDSGYERKNTCVLYGDACKTCPHKDIDCKKDVFELGDNDKDLMKRLRNAGTDHRKFMRMITVYVDITAPLYWWKEFDTYKVGTVANSCSTMHKIHAKEFTFDDFSCEHLDTEISMVPADNNLLPIMTTKQHLGYIISMLNYWRDRYNVTKDKRCWWQMIQLLPSSYNQKRTVMLNYEVLANMYKSRKNHKLDEWRELCEWCKTLPYSKLITGNFEE